MSAHHRWRPAGVHHLLYHNHQSRNIPMHHTVVAHVQNHPGVLNRIVSVFRRRGINIESLTVARTEQPTISCMTWVVTADNVTPVVAQLEKLIDVLDVYIQPGQGRSSVQAVVQACAPSSSLAAAQADGVA